MPRLEKSIWDVAVNECMQREKAKDDADKESSLEGAESNVLIMGSKDAGKTSLILRFLEKEEKPKATIALEYTFGRKAKGHNMNKDIVHIWELGGGTSLSQLIEVPISKSTLLNCSIILVLDLSEPNKLWYTAETLLKAAQDRVEAVIRKASAQNPKIYEEIKSRAWKRIGEQHPDRDILDPFPLPMVILGMKYDLFQNLESEKRKLIARTLRFLAHNYGASLQFCSSKMENLMSKGKQQLGHLAFGTSVSIKQGVQDHNKPISITAGSDGMDVIGLPPVKGDDIGRGNARTPLELWKQAFTAVFPQEAVEKEMAADPSKDPQYRESAVDNVRAQKDKELEKYKKKLERKAKTNQLAGPMGDVS
ncbi:cytoplasmic dynein 2 light intermediate chain 1-like [Apostichopus japonicus]|uniref:cytoplasmic dynein 2 light intermediate chain 1-like n=1 Tax=Stichopus japonicus TaxID=307972 RepID=UPI003AB2FEDA